MRPTRSTTITCVLGVDLSMTPEQFSMEWGRNLSSPRVILLIFMIFVPIFCFVFAFFGIAIFRPALLASHRSPLGPCAPQMARSHPVALSCAGHIHQHALRSG